MGKAMTRIPFCLALAAIAWSAPRDANAQGPEAGVTYWTEVTLDQSTCDKVTVQPGPTLITRAGNDSVTVSHANQTYRGTLSPTGDFTTTPRDLVFGSTTYTIAIVGKMAGEGFTATVTVGVRESGQEKGCRYSVTWVGRRQ
jgi:hypothetical protein